ncbi:Piso0_002242 [Millerozyma farinosa CBS 7064]|uniref:non-specific serine/threonine protein kinase n=1 Tax=Pichia sorbitophila (strain ATCC MYA-4447 / BCRC 22081 / CBS 7064 / NBRC 10061 / NRRL Y-12695) TaxID=559304 RepID=G8YEI2_PICSO|nr:Piso0_002242 [Millerozyma farinosa CBS 7064]
MRLFRSKKSSKESPDSQRTSSESRVSPIKSDSSGSVATPGSHMLSTKATQDRNANVVSEEKLASSLKKNLHLDVGSSGKEGPEVSRLKRASTAIEDKSDDEEAYNESFEDTDEESTSDSSESDSDSVSDDSDRSHEVEHLHVVKVRAKALSNHSNLVNHFSNLMGYCGVTSLSRSSLQAMANEESKRTFSFLDPDMKIHRLSSKIDRGDPKSKESVIGDQQLVLIDQLRKKLEQIILNANARGKQYDIVSNGKTLYNRYGVVKDIIGRGAYGIIKIIDPYMDTSNINQKSSEAKYLYAVKELAKRVDDDFKSKAGRDKFIDRVVSEFILSSTLNYKHIVRSVDLMVALPPLNDPKNMMGDTFKINQVMECSPGGDLFSYMSTMADTENNHVNVITVEEIDCFIKQIAKGLCYMHLHGVAHCDLKLENILIDYEPPTGDALKKKVILRLSDFGKSNVFRTKWDQEEQIIPYGNGPIGSEPYIAPEEHECKLKRCSGFSSKRKDCWALGIVILVLFNIRRNFFEQKHESHDDSDDLSILDGYSSGYLWSSTELKTSIFKKAESYRYKDKVFDEYVQNRMIASYENKSKEWLIKRKGTFHPIERLFKVSNNEDHLKNDSENKREVKPAQKNKQNETYRDQDNDDYDLQMFSLRKMFIYALLDPNPKTRLSVEELCTSDWLTAVDQCVD